MLFSSLFLAMDSFPSMHRSCRLHRRHHHFHRRWVSHVDVVVMLVVNGDGGSGGRGSDGGGYSFICGSCCVGIWWRSIDMELKGHVLTSDKDFKWEKMGVIRELKGEALEDFMAEAQKSAVAAQKESDDKAWGLFMPQPQTMTAKGGVSAWVCSWVCDREPNTYVCSSSVPDICYSLISQGTRTCVVVAIRVPTAMCKSMCLN
jgi:hypothetical protein